MKLHPLLLIIMSALMGCTMFKPACPSITTYPGAVVISYTDQEEIIRTTTYIAPVGASTQDILGYYRKNLEAGGWSMDSQQAQRIDFEYSTSNNQPPFDLSVIIDKEDNEPTRFRVAIRINGPFAWRNWCSTLKP
jgi:hypothetical protein